MTGTVFFPLSEQIADTARAHGLHWAASYYAKRGVPINEFFMLARVAGLL
jgi:hypothetical protein